MNVSSDLIALAERVGRSYTPAVLAVRIESSVDGELVLALARASEAIGSLAGGEVHASVDLEAAGVIVRQWGFVPDIGDWLRALGRELGRHGMDGRLVVHDSEPPKVSVPIPLRERRQELLECHLRVRGERRLYLPMHDLLSAVRRGEEAKPPVVGFFPDDAALLAGIESALAWVGSPPAGIELWSPAGPHRDVGELRAYIAEEFASSETRKRVSTNPHQEAELRSHPSYKFVAQDTRRLFIGVSAWWESGDAFRLMVISPGTGDVSLAGGGARFAGGEWEPTYSALLKGLHEASGWGSYGLIKRGRQPSQVGRSLPYDWVPAFHFGSYNLTHFDYEDVLAPDAFGAQLLGRGYLGRIPEGADWERVGLDNDATLLFHRDPAAWYAHPLPPITTEDSMLRNPAYPVPDVIVRARGDFAGIVITSDVVRAHPLDPLAG